MRYAARSEWRLMSTMTSVVFAITGRSGTLFAAASISRKVTASSLMESSWISVSCITYSASKLIPNSHIKVWHSPGKDWKQRSTTRWESGVPNRLDQQLSGSNLKDVQPAKPYRWYSWLISKLAQASISYAADCSWDQYHRQPSSWILQYCQRIQKCAELSSFWPQVCPPYPSDWNWCLINRLQHECKHKRIGITHHFRASLRLFLHTFPREPWEYCRTDFHNGVQFSELMTVRTSWFWGEYRLEINYHITHISLFSFHSHLTTEDRALDFVDLTSLSATLSDKE